MNSTYFKYALVFSSIVAIGIILYNYSEEILSIGASEEIHTLLCISNALKQLTRTIDDIETAFYVHKSHMVSNEKLAIFSKQLAVAHNDIDFLFEKLDSIRGNEDVKQKRKNCVMLTKDLSARVDKLIEDFKAYKVA